MRQTLSCAAASYPGARESAEQPPNMPGVKRLLSVRLKMPEKLASCPVDPRPLKDTRWWSVARAVSDGCATALSAVFVHRRHGRAGRGTRRAVPGRPLRRLTLFP